MNMYKIKMYLHMLANVMKMQFISSNICYIIDYCTTLVQRTYQAFSAKAFNPMLSTNIVKENCIGGFNSVYH